jgi:tricorn protease-like protein
MLLQVREPNARWHTDLYQATYEQGRTCEDDRLVDVHPFKALPEVEERAAAFDSHARPAFCTALGPAFYAGDDLLVEGFVERASFSPDGRRMAWSEEVPPLDTRRLYTANSDGTDRKEWDYPGFELHSLKFSADSKRIWFTCGNLYSIDVETGKYRRHDLDQPAYMFDLSSDGSRLAYLAHGGQLRCRNLNTGREKKLAQFPGRPVGPPTFSPDGTRVLFATEDYHERSAFWVVSSKGGQPRQLSTEPVVTAAVHAG